MSAYDLDDSCRPLQKCLSGRLEHLGDRKVPVVAARLELLTRDKNHFGKLVIRDLLSPMDMEPAIGSCQGGNERISAFSAVDQGSVCRRALPPDAGRAVAWAPADNRETQPDVVPGWVTFGPGPGATFAAHRYRFLPRSGG
jgi:hypothetical protein